jgi:hypothetical protein
VPITFVLPTLFIQSTFRELTTCTGLSPLHATDTICETRCGQGCFCHSLGFEGAKNNLS